MYNVTSLSEARYNTVLGQGGPMITKSELDFIAEAKQFLEKDSSLMTLVNMIGAPIDMAIKRLPERVEKKLMTTVESALQKSLEIAVKSTFDTPTPNSWEQSLERSNLNRHAHTGVTALTGAIGGFFGAPGAIIELPISTTLIMRNIASIANDFNLNPADPEIALQCLYVFTLGSKKTTDDTMDSAYYSARLGFLALLRNGTAFFGIGAKGAAPQVMQFVSRVARQFQISVSEKLLAETMPVLGAITGAGVNAAFTDYFGKAARYHFGMLALEKRLGEETVKKAYRES